MHADTVSGGDDLASRHFQGLGGHSFKKQLIPSPDCLPSDSSPNAAFTTNPGQLLPADRAPPSGATPSVPLLRSRSSTAKRTLQTCLWPPLTSTLPTLGCPGSEPLTPQLPSGWWLLGWHRTPPGPRTQLHTQEGRAHAATVHPYPSWRSTGWHLRVSRSRAT